MWWCWILKTYATDINFVDQLTIEVDFTTLDLTKKEAKWPRSFVVDILVFLPSNLALPLHCDSQATLARAGNKLLIVLKIHYLFLFNSCLFGYLIWLYIDFIDFSCPTCWVANLEHIDTANWSEIRSKTSQRSKVDLNYNFTTRSIYSAMLTLPSLSVFSW